MSNEIFQLRFFQHADDVIETQWGKNTYNQIGNPPSFCTVLHNHRELSQSINWKSIQIDYY